tara:strand:+ start:4232 stop:5059 length:828 start_codon:yes stop_codon:yes gene_type:complete
MDYPRIRLLEHSDQDIFSLHAYEDAILEGVSQGSLPTILFSRLSKPGISISYKQNLRLDVDVEAVSSRGVDITRRITGGRSMYLDGRYDIVSVVLPCDSLDIDGMYRKVCGRVTNVLSGILGIGCGIENKNDLVLDNGKKIGGAAQRIKGKAVLVHAYVRYEDDLDDVLSLVKVDGVGLTDYRSDFASFTAHAREFTELDRTDFYERLRDGFCRDLNVVKGNLSSFELDSLEGRIRHYKDSSWVEGSGDEPSRGHCDLIAGDKIRIKELEHLNFR